MIDKVDIDKLTIAERKLANLCDHCDVPRDTIYEEHEKHCPAYLYWEQWSEEQYENQMEEQRWREYENEMWDDERGDWKC